jgi:hypothetical protein
MMKKTVYPTSSKPDQDTDNNPNGCVLKAIRFGVHQRPVLIKPTLIKSLNICQN